MNWKQRLYIAAPPAERKQITSLLLQPIHTVFPATYYRYIGESREKCSSLVPEHFMFILMSMSLATWYCPACRMLNNKALKKQGDSRKENHEKAYR